MDYFFSEELKEIQNLARQVAQEKIAPVAAHYDETGEFPWDIMKTLANMDFFRI
jgi:alkylation response protein AidB-like acyl-CoA dehydrogenase